MSWLSPFDKQKNIGTIFNVIDFILQSFTVNRLQWINIVLLLKGKNKNKFLLSRIF